MASVFRRLFMIKDKKKEQPSSQVKVKVVQTEDQSQILRKAQKERQKPYTKTYGPRSESEIQQLEKAKEYEQQAAFENKMEAAKQSKKEVGYHAQKKYYAGTSAGKISKAGTGFFKAFQQFGRPAGAKAYYQSTGQLPPTGYNAGTGKKGRVTLPGFSSGKGRGRPKGTLNPLYAQYGGVYGWRKAMAHERAMAKLQAQRQTPQFQQQQFMPQMRTPQRTIPRIVQNQPMSFEQKQYIQFLRQQEAARRRAVERATVPDTYGEVDLDESMKEIDKATGMID